MTLLAIIIRVAAELLDPEAKMPCNEVEVAMLRLKGYINRPLADAIIAETKDRNERFVLVGIAGHETGFDETRVGDHGLSKGPYQRLNGPDSFAWDSRASTREALRQVRESFRACYRLPREERLSLYARGKCDHPRGHELSREIMSMAKQAGWR